MIVLRGFVRIYARFELKLSVMIVLSSSHIQLAATAALLLSISPAYLDSQRQTKLSPSGGDPTYVIALYTCRQDGATLLPI